eukprot:4327381-Pleurochrysis_carterae.AAC.1
MSGTRSVARTATAVVRVSAQRGGGEREGEREGDHKGGSEGGSERGRGEKSALRAAHEHATVGREREDKELAMHRQASAGRQREGTR